MQKMDESKRRDIAAAAARRFAANPFHDVKLDHVAADAGVGKGTIYLYYRDKDDLYISVLCDAFESLVASLRERIAGSTASARAELRLLLGTLVRFAVANPELFRLMRASPPEPGSRWAKKRDEMIELFESVIRRGVRLGEFHKTHPRLAAACIPGMVRSVMLFGPEGLSERTVLRHLTALVERGLLAPGAGGATDA